MKCCECFIFITNVDGFCKDLIFMMYNLLKYWELIKKVFLFLNRNKNFDQIKEIIIEFYNIFV